MTTTTRGQKAYTSVQTGPNTRIELNSDLVFCNHSCAPYLVFDISRFEARVADERLLKKGDSPPFFHPSTEWDIAQPFHCTCGAKESCGCITGAKAMDSGMLEKYWLNSHIAGLRNKSQ